MPRPPRCLPASRSMALRLAPSPPPLSPLATVRTDKHSHTDSAIRSVLDTPHRRRAGLVLVLAMLLAVWLHQASTVPSADQQPAADPLPQALSIDEPPN